MEHDSIEQRLTDERNVWLATSPMKSPSAKPYPRPGVYPLLSQRLSASTNTSSDHALSWTAQYSARCGRSRCLPPRKNARQRMRPRYPDGRAHRYRCNERRMARMTGGNLRP